MNGITSLKDSQAATSRLADKNVWEIETLEIWEVLSWEKVFQLLNFFADLNLSTLFTDITIKFLPPIKH